MLLRRGQTGPTLDYAAGEKVTPFNVSERGMRGENKLPAATLRPPDNTPSHRCSRAAWRGTLLFLDYRTGCWPFICMCSVSLPATETNSSVILVISVLGFN